MSSPEYLDPGLWQHLPDEVLEQVLPRLPLESIFRFRAVCKKWHQLPLSPSFRASCTHTTSQTPLLVAMRNVEDLHLTPVLPSHGKKWRRLGLTCLHQALLHAQCDRITATGSDGGLLCVSALNRISRSVVVVCNPLTETCKLLPYINTPWIVVFRQLIVRVEHSSGHYRIFLSGQDLHGRRQAIYVYHSRSDSVTPLPRVTHSLSRTYGAFRGDIYYTLSRDYELVGYDTASPNWTEVNTGITMTDQGDGYKILSHDDRLFCAVAKEGNPIARDDVVEFRIYELELDSRRCVRVNINLQCLFVNDSLCSAARSRYDWDFVVHRECLLLVARSRVEDPCNTRWLEVFVGTSPHDRGSVGHGHGSVGVTRSPRFPSLARAFSSPGETWRFTDKFGSRSLSLSTLRLDLAQGLHFDPCPEKIS